MGVPVQLKIVSKNVQSCARSFIIPSLKINKIIVTDEFIVKNSERNRYMITSPDEIKGKSPHQALYFYLEIFLQICGYFKEETVRKAVSDLPRIISNCEVSKKELNRIGDSNNLIVSKLRESNKT